MIAINEAMARRLFGSNDALGRRLQWGGGAATPLQIVAIVGDVKVGGPREDTQLRFYIPVFQLTTIRPNWILASLRLLIRTIPDPAIVVPSLRGLVASDARVSGAQVETGSDLSVGRSPGNDQLRRFSESSAYWRLAWPLSVCMASSTTRSFGGGTK